MTLDLVAQMVMDSFYQEFSKDSDFFQLEDFTRYTYAAYSSLLQDDFDKSIKKNYQLRGEATPELNDEWFTVKKFPVEHSTSSDFIKIGPFFSFENDSDFTSIKGIFVDGEVCGCHGFHKIKYTAVQTLKYLPKSDKSFYYYPLADKIHLVNGKCSLKEVNLIYIPMLNDDNSELIKVPETLVSDIIMNTLKLMRESKDNTVIDMTSNQNPNKVIQTEIQDPSVKK